MERRLGSGTRCPACGAGELISISMTLNGAELAFTACHECEAKWWWRDGESVPLQVVLESVTPGRSR